MIRASLYVFPQYLSVGPGIICQTSVIFTEASQFPTCDTGMGPSPRQTGDGGGTGVRGLWLADNRRDHHCLAQSGLQRNYQHQHSLLAQANLTHTNGDGIFVLANRKV